MKVAIIGGGGRVGSCAAFALQCSGIVKEIVMLDANQAAAEGEALDLLHGAAFLRRPGHSPPALTPIAPMPASSASPPACAANRMNPGSISSTATSRSSSGSCRASKRPA